MNKKLKILFFCTIIAGGGAYSQILPSPQGSLLPNLKNLKNSSPSAFIERPIITTWFYKPFLAADFYSKKLGFFCQQEIKMDKATRIPFRFRLGSVEQCNWLEGKVR